jgi:hypothetical protein
MKYSSSGKLLRLRWAAACMDCNRALSPGDRALWFHLDDVGRCMTCAEAPDPMLQPSSTATPAADVPTVAASGTKVASPPSAPEPVQAASAPAPGSTRTADPDTLTNPGLRKLRWAARCSGCADEIPAGSMAQWDRATKSAQCVECMEDAAQTCEGGAGRRVLHEQPVSPAHSTPIETGRAGASARRQYERRAAKERTNNQKAIEADERWRAQIRAERPILGWVATKVIAKPTMMPESQATVAWKTGAAGEERVAQVLADAPITALHDRRIPRSKANIDHIAIGPAGVFVIDAKKYKGQVEKRDLGGWISPDVRLYVNGRNQTKLVQAVAKQVDVVRTALGDLAEATPVHGVLCFVDASWPGWRPKPIRFGAVTCIWPLGLPGLIASPDVLQAEQIAAITAGLAKALPAA